MKTGQALTAALAAIATGAASAAPVSFLVNYGKNHTEAFANQIEAADAEDFQAADANVAAGTLVNLLGTTPTPPATPVARLLEGSTPGHCSPWCHGKLCERRAAST